MNSFCDTVFVTVMLLRRREAGERGKMKARGARWEGGKEVFSHFPSSTAPLIFFHYCRYFYLNTQWEPLRRREVIEDFLK